MKKQLLLSLCLAVVSVSPLLASGLPKLSVQALIKALQDSNVEVRTAAAQALAQVPDAAEQADKPLETALIASAEANEQDALVKAWRGDAMGNLQFTAASAFARKPNETTISAFRGKAYVPSIGRHFGS